VTWDLKPVPKQLPKMKRVAEFTNPFGSLMPGPIRIGGFGVTVKGDLIL
jgi:hypothetical protein